MPVVFPNLVKERTLTVGTGDLVLNGAVSGNFTFAAKVADGATFYYRISDGVAQEGGLGTYVASTNRVQRTTVSFSSAGGTTKISLTGHAKVWIDVLGEWFASVSTGGGDAFTSQPLSQFAATTSAQLAGVILNETGFATGAVLVFNTSPGFVTAITPLVTGAASVGTAALPWSNVYLAATGTINWANGNMVLSQSPGVLQVSGGYLYLSNTGFSLYTAGQIVTRGSISDDTNATLTIPGGTDGSTTFGTVIVGGGASASEIRFMEPSGSGTNYTGFKAPALAGNVIYTLPTADGTSGQVLSTNGSKVLSWATGSGGGGGTWGSITGTLSDQTDLQTALGAKLAKAGGTMTGALLFTDNTLDIGASGATRPRRGYFGTEVVSPLFTGALAGNASTVTTNANLAGPIASSGNTTSITSQTGTGTTFVMRASPDMTGTPTAPTAVAGTNTTQIATTAFVTDAVGTAVTGLLEFKGSTDCSSNPNYPAASKGDSYLVSVAGKIGGASGASVDVGDMYVAIADNAGGTQASVGTSWTVLEHNLQGALLSANNLSDLASATTARTNLGLVIGTNVQAYDADLTTWAGITPGTGVGTALAVNVGSAGAFVTINGAGGTPSSINLANGTALPIAGLTASTSTALGVGSIELGHATDTTISRSASGLLAVEGNIVPHVAYAATWTAAQTLTAAAPQLILGANTTTLGSMKLFGSTSGDVTVKPAAIAGTATIFQFPSNNGTNGYVLQTNGSGVTSWAVASGSTIVNTIHIDQTPSASSSYGSLSGTVNGSNAVFTVANGAYVTGTLTVLLNGQQQTQGTGKDWAETTPASGTFTFATAPPTGSVVQAMYSVSATGSGVVTNTGGNLTSNAVVLGAGTNDTKVVAGITTDGTSVIILGVNATTLGKAKFFGNTSGDATIQPPAAAGTSTVVTLPNASSTLPIFGQQVTFSGPTAARTYTLVDANGTVVDTSSTQTLSGKTLQGVAANAQTGTTYTLALTDDGLLVTLSNASAITLTVPTNASVAFPVGAEIEIGQLGAGQVTVSAAGGVTINSYGSAVRLAGQYAGGRLKKTATNTWVLTGNII